MAYTFRVVIEDDEFADGTPAFTARCPALPGCHTWGYTYEHARERIQEAVELFIEIMLEDGEPIPEDDSVGSEDCVMVAVGV